MAQRPSPRTDALMDDLAERMANGCASIAQVARDMGIGQARADQVWQRIRRGLGEQAV